MSSTYRSGTLGVLYKPKGAKGIPKGQPGMSHGLHLLADRERRGLVKGFLEQRRGIWRPVQMIPPLHQPDSLLRVAGGRNVRFGFFSYSTMITFPPGYAPMLVICRGR